MKKQSIWLKDFKNDVTILDKDIDCDVLIIGAGITGLSTAYHLIGSNLKVVVVEKDEIGNDVTARTTGKITYLQELIYTRLKKVFEYAKENNFDIVSTTLTISPYQNHEIIKQVGKKLQEEYGIEFRYIDYTENFRQGQKMARELDIYMQKYCGCVFSIDAGKWVY